MSVRKIEGFVYTCDECDKEHRAESMRGHYTESTPPGWMSIRWYVGEANVRGDRLLCQVCCEGFLNEIAELRGK